MHYLYTAYIICSLRIKSGGGFLFITPFVHYSFLPVVLITFSAKLFNSKFTRPMFLILCVIAYAVSTFLFLMFVDYLSLGDALMDHLDNYITGYYAAGELNDHSIKFRIAQVLGILAFYVFFFLSAIRLREYTKYGPVCLYGFIYVIVMAYEYGI